MHFSKKLVHCLNPVQGESKCGAAGFTMNWPHLGVSRNQMLDSMWPARCLSSYGTTKERLWQWVSPRAGRQHGACWHFLGRYSHCTFCSCSAAWTPDCACVMHCISTGWDLGVIRSVWWNILLWNIQCGLSLQSTSAWPVQHQSAKHSADEMERQVHPAGLMRHLLSLSATGGQ